MMKNDPQLHRLEIKNYNQAFNTVKKGAKLRAPLNEQVVLELHRTIMQGLSNMNGVYRNFPIYVSGASHDFPDSGQLPILLNNFYEKLEYQSMICGLPESKNPLELAAWTHGEFVNLHPFADGNGRVSRLMVNYQLMERGYLPISIPLDERENYYKLLDDYYHTRNETKLAGFFTHLEEEEISRRGKAYEAFQNQRNGITKGAAERIGRHMGQREHRRSNFHEL